MAPCASLQITSGLASCRTSSATAYYAYKSLNCNCHWVTRFVHVRTCASIEVATIRKRQLIKRNCDMCTLWSWEINYGVYPCVAMLPFLHGNFVLDRLTPPLAARAILPTHRKLQHQCYFSVCTDTAIQQHMKTVQGGASGRFIWLNLKEKAFFMQGYYGT